MEEAQLKADLERMRTSLLEAQLALRDHEGTKREADLLGEERQQLSRDLQKVTDDRTALVEKVRALRCWREASPPMRVYLCIRTTIHTPG